MQAQIQRTESRWPRERRAQLDAHARLGDNKANEAEVKNGKLAQLLLLNRRAQPRPQRHRARVPKLSPFVYQ